jgi:hypothetical protein
MHGTDEDGNEMVWKKDMLCCKTINQIMTEPLQGKRHRIGLLISPPPWVGVKRAIGVDEDGKGYVEYNPGHVSLFFILAAPPGKQGRTLAIWDADADGEIERKVKERKLHEPLQAREGFTGIQYHLYCNLADRAQLAGIYIGGTGNQGRIGCGPLAIDALLSWVRGKEGELSTNNLGEMGRHKLSK